MDKGMDGKVTIINFNSNADSIVSAAGRISTTEGCADEIYYNSCNNDIGKNINLINKILASGHKSILEHISVNLSFNNVSVFVEQFLIEFRLASFTVKSRRYVDFGRMGYIVPDFPDNGTGGCKSLEKIYCRHMDYLFDRYNYFVEKGIPKEDARFILPYSFRSNFYCTVNARELVKIMNEMVYGRGREYPEIAMLGKSLLRQCEKKLPYLNAPEPQPGINKTVQEIYDNYRKKSGCKDISGKRKDESLVSLLYGTGSPENIICMAHALSCAIPAWQDIAIDNPGQQKLVIKELLGSSRKRELEQAHFTFSFNKISLAGVTHLVRHRMQSVIIPKYTETCNYNEYVLPVSIADAGLEEEYKSIFEKSGEIAGTLKNNGLSTAGQAYLLLSGLTVPVMTTMNANELCTFIRLRTCNRAQWEIKACADALLSILRERYPVLFSLYGPACYMTGNCPEGRMSCNKMKEVFKKYNMD